MNQRSVITDRDHRHLREGTLLALSLGHDLRHYYRSAGAENASRNIEKSRGIRKIDGGPVFIRVTEAKDGKDREPNALASGLPIEPID